MSQQSYPSFHLNASFFDSQQSQSSGAASFQQWPPQGPRPLGNANSRPSHTFRPARSAPNPTNIMNFNQSSLFHHDNRIDPNHALLQVPPLTRPRSALDNLSNVNPITRFYNDDSPWSSERMRNPNASVGRSALVQPNMEYGSYREGPGSEIESVAPKSDSGYQSQQTQSILGVEPEQCNQELPSETFKMSNISFNSASSERTEMQRLESIDQASQYSSRSTGHGKEFKCPHCKETSKCKSDHKKHMLKHDKPFKCDVPGCRREGRGFTTVNDLNRHKKSVHRIGALENSYQCASEHCRNKEKIWPRLDNFKQHVNRMHQDENETDLIQRSVYHPQETPPSAQALSVAPMDTTLAGIGTEKQFSSNDFDESVPGISLTPDQATHPWISFEPNSSHSFAMDVDQANPNLYCPGSGRPNMDINAGFRLSGQGQPSAYDAHAGPLDPRITPHNTSDRLDALATLASSQASPDKPVAQLPPQLSREPQTKADQQKQLLQKLFSNVIAQSSNNEPVDVDNAVRRMLSSAARWGQQTTASSHQSAGQMPTQGSSTGQNTSHEPELDTMTRTEVIKALQALSNQIKQTGKRPIGVNNRPKPFSNNSKTCSECNVSLARPCDLKKHMKRHTRPYGCTYPKCYKRFGAKSDWKRHENSQHFQLESYRCQLLSHSSQTPCGELFYRAEVFKDHLQSHHKMSDTGQLNHEIKMRRIGRNGQGQFWCGFCKDIVKLKEKRNAAWDERFDHIDNHFKKKQGIEEWLCLEAKKTKGEVLKEMDKNSFDEDDMEGLSPDDTSPSESQEDQEVPPPGASPIASSSNPRKRRASAEPSAQPNSKKGFKRDFLRYCCQCLNGPWLHNTYSDCMNCSHRLCNGCTQNVNVHDEEGMGLGMEFAHQMGV